VNNVGNKMQWSAHFFLVICC